MCKICAKHCLIWPDTTYDAIINRDNNLINYNFFCVFFFLNCAKKRRRRNRFIGFGQQRPADGRQRERKERQTIAQICERERINWTAYIYIHRCWHTYTQIAQCPHLVKNLQSTSKQKRVKTIFVSLFFYHFHSVVNWRISMNEYSSLYWILHQQKQQ